MMIPLSANRQWIPMEIYITLCIGDWSTGTSDFIEAAGSADTDTRTETFLCVETCAFVLFFFFSPASLERNSFAPIRKKFYYDQEPRFFARH